ncbi:MAG: hypothetical protein M1825_001381 [Sarcosagium campestre]|nr:MAG: hypothetical protein M1825_001381 [Sarcosagium campestre]
MARNSPRIKARNSDELPARIQAKHPNMTSKLVPSNPSDVTVIRDVTPNIVTASAPFLRFGKFKIGGRGTIVRLTSGALAVFSPTALTPELKSKIASLGNDVRYIAALDLEHHIFLGAWHAAFPTARVIGPEGLPEKRAAQKNEQVPFATVFTAGNRADTRIGADFDADFDYEYVGSHASKELVFLYRPDRTLIEADLFFNLPANEQYSRTGDSPTTGLWSKLFNGLQHTHGDATWQKRFIWYVSSAGDRPAFADSVARIAKWDFDRIIPCHGDVIESGGQGIFRKVFDWHLQGRK